MLAQGYFFLNEKDITQPIKGWGTTSSARRCGSNCASAAPQGVFFFNTHLAHRVARRGRRYRSGGAHRVGETHRRADEADRGRYAPIFVTGDMNASYAAGDGRRTCLDGFFEFMWSARETAPTANDDVYSYNNFGEGTRALRGTSTTSSTAR
ncbi:MAG: hypothetical protein ACLRMJ_03640 [Alistipes finegoldii]